MASARKDWCRSTRGLFLAGLLFLAWLTSLAVLLSVGPVPTSAAAAAEVLLVSLFVALRTFLQTGLFIVAHDAMHGSLFPPAAALNHGVGRLALFLYACLPYGGCRRQHLRHHRRPGDLRDPDFHDGVGRDLPRWYAGFMARYVSVSQLAGLLLLWGSSAALLGWGPGSTWPRLFSYWILPLVLSSIQLFLFGTYLPHRQQCSVGCTERHEVISSDLPPWLSLLTCYYFGYHREHHDHPEVPWHRLPQLRLELRRR